jgi:hypothetical protein
VRKCRASSLWVHLIDRLLSALCERLNPEGLRGSPVAEGRRLHSWGARMPGRCYSCDHAVTVPAQWETPGGRRGVSQLGATPAMAAGVSDRLWEMGDVVKLLEDFGEADRDTEACCTRAR